jgi:hypothetical protein
VGSTEMLLDGISYVDRFGGGISRVQPGLDTVQEFRIETTGSAAQFARPATVELVTRSGTNELHGSAFEVFRNNAAGLRARARQDGNTPAKLIRNEYGFWVGGPVWLPKLYNGKNKTFWFVDWEGSKQRQDSFAQTAVATPAMWAGDLSNITDSSGDVYTIYDPLTTSGPNGTRLPFTPNNVIPQSRFNPIAKLMQSVSPLPMGPNAGGNPWTDQNFATYYSVPQDTGTLTLKGDETFSEKDNLSARFTRSTNNNKTLGGRFGFPPPGCTNCGGTGRQDVAVFSEYVRWNHVFKPTLLNELQISGHRSTDDAGTLGDSTNWASKLGFPNPLGALGWPSIYTDAYNMFYSGGWDGDNRKNQMLTAFQIEDNVTWIKGKHTFKFGFKGRQEYNNVRELQNQEGAHGFYSHWTTLYDPSADAATAYTGSGFAEMLMGLPSDLRIHYNRGYFYYQQKEIGAYFNDTWKLSPRLTVDVGLRWDHWTPYHEKYDRLVNLDPTNYVGKFQVVSPHNTNFDNLPGVPSGVLDSFRARGMSWTTADQAHFPGALIQNYWKDLGPRLAIAYKLSDKWVLRSGYGIYYWPMPLSQILQSARVNPPLDLRFHHSLYDQNTLNPDYALLNVPASTDYLPNATIDTNGIVPLPGSREIFLFDPHNWADDRMQQWTFTIERELMKNTSLRLSYIGNHGSNLEQRMNWNSSQSQWNYQLQTGLAAASGSAGTDSRRANPNWTGVLESHVGYSNANSFQAEVQRRLSNGLEFQWFYTYNHTLTTSDEGGFGSGGGGAFVPEDATILGQPNLTLSQRLKLVYYNSASVPPHRITWNGIYELPFGRGKKFAGGVSKPLDYVVGGWQLAFIGTWQSGNWMGVTGSDYLFGNPALGKGQRLKMTIFGKTQELYFRGDFNPASATNVDLAKLEHLVPVDRSQRVLHPLYYMDSSGKPVFNSNRLPFQLADGSTRYTTITDNLSWNSQNFFLGPGQWNEDLSVYKYFNFTEKVKMRVTSDFFNFFNHPNNVTPNKTTGLLDLSVQSNDPRIIQLSARLEW